MTVAGGAWVAKDNGAGGGMPLNRPAGARIYFCVARRGGRAMENPL